MNEDTSYIVYFESNSLYVYVMVQSLPYGGFKCKENVGINFDFNIPTELHENDSNFRIALNIRNHQYQKNRTWVETCIEFNNTHGSNASNEFERNLFKLMNNALLGKTMKKKRVKTP